MTEEAGGRGSAPRSLDEMWALRSDYQDVPIPALSGEVLRVYALTGTARAVLMGEMGALAQSADPDNPDPATVARILEFQGRVAAASLGYPQEEWDALGTVIGGEAVEAIYETAATLSKLTAESQEEEKDRQPRKRSAASGTD